MEYILKVLRIHGMRFKLFSAVSFVIFSIQLSACGGSGPSDEGEGSYSNTSTSKKSNLPTLVLDNPPSGVVVSSIAFCLQQNSLLCEDFEWSSSLDYQATNLDWKLKGWQYSGGSNLNGNLCGVYDSDKGQCHLQWMQRNNIDKDVRQKASYLFSEYGAGESHVEVSWSTKWSDNWRWGAKGSHLINLESLDAKQQLNPIVSVDVDTNGFLQLVIYNKEVCGKTEIIKADALIALTQEQLGQWHKFKLTLDSASVVNTTAINLSLNNRTIISTEVSGAACSGINRNANGLTFLTNLHNINAIGQQNVAIDNVLVLFK